MSWYTKPVGYIKPLGKALGTGILAFGLATGLFACGDSSTVGPNGDYDACADCDSGYEDDADAHQSDNDDSGNLEDDDSSIDGGNDTENPLNPPDKIDTSKIKPPLDSEIVLGDSLEYGLIVPPGEDLVCRVNIIGPGVDKMLKEGSCNPDEFFGGNLDTGDGYQKGDYNLDFLVKNDAGSVDAERGFALVEESVGAPVIESTHHTLAHVSGRYFGEFNLTNNNVSTIVEAYNLIPADFRTGNPNTFLSIQDNQVGNLNDAFTEAGYVEYTLKACNGSECNERTTKLWVNKYTEGFDITLNGQVYSFDIANPLGDKIFHGDSELGLEDCGTERIPTYDGEGNEILELAPGEQSVVLVTDSSRFPCLYTNVTAVIGVSMQEIVERNPMTAEYYQEILDSQLSDVEKVRSSRTGPN